MHPAAPTKGVPCAYPLLSCPPSVVTKPMPHAPSNTPLRTSVRKLVTVTGTWLPYRPGDTPQHRGASVSERQGRNCRRCCTPRLPLLLMLPPALALLPLPLHHSCCCHSAADGAPAALLLSPAPSRPAHPAQCALSAVRPPRGWTTCRPGCAQ